jgi:CBS domain-containing protein
MLVDHVNGASPHTPERIAMKVKELMRTSVPRPSPLVSVSEALSAMDRAGVTLLPVEDADGWLLGVARPADLSRALNAGSLAPLATIGDGVVPHLLTATPDMNVARVAELMRERGLDDIMVVKGRSLVGALAFTQAGQAATNLRSEV